MKTNVSFLHAIQSVLTILITRFWTTEENQGKPRKYENGIYWLQSKITGLFTATVGKNKSVNVSGIWYWDWLNCCCLMEVLCSSWVDRVGRFAQTYLFHLWMNRKYRVSITNHLRITVTRAFMCSCYMLLSLFETIDSPHVKNAAVRGLGPPSSLVGRLLIGTTGIKCGVKWGKFRGNYCVVTTHCTVYSTVLSALPAFESYFKCQHIIKFGCSLAGFIPPKP